MQETTAPMLTAWQSFYVIVGSSGAALTGLMFVVITLVADSPRRRSSGAVSAYTTPSVIHFGAVLLVAAIISAPWKTLGAVGLTIGLIGVAGIVYEVMVIRRILTIDAYQPVLEDWTWHCALPTIAYVTFLGTALPLAAHPEPALFGIGASALLLLFVGIHNAWDTVIFLVLGSPEAPTSESAGASEQPAREQTTERLSTESASD